MRVSEYQKRMKRVSEIIISHAKWQTKIVKKKRITKQNMLRVCVCVRIGKREKRKTMMDKNT